MFKTGKIKIEICQTFINAELITYILQMTLLSGINFILDAVSTPLKLLNSLVLLMVLLA